MPKLSQIAERKRALRRLERAEDQVSGRRNQKEDREQKERRNAQPLRRQPNGARMRRGGMRPVLTG
ncbi:hypothetical protein [Tianweitania sp.]|uniref:hypothetical protein n=1 Tax=Tianweitania sp. TaxID=2021634 RepID=UPI0028A1053C|nr:hypothetical protein [Tianweitania sp.]